jgi:hypothetical protein
MKLIGAKKTETKTKGKKEGQQKKQKGGGVIDFKEAS